MSQKGLLAQESPREQKESFALECARKLANVIKLKRLRSERINFKKWIEEFERLEKKQPQDVIQKVLDWYILNITKEYVPEAYSALSFRKKFDQIRKQVDDQPISEKELSAQELVILHRAQRLSWPNGVDALLPKIIKTSYSRYAEFRARVAKAIIELREKAKQLQEANDKTWARVQRLANVAHHLISTNKLPTPVMFLDNWLADLSSMVQRGYSPSLARMTFGVTNPDFAKRAMGSVYAYCADSRVWNELLKEMGIDESK